MNRIRELIGADYAHARGIYGRGIGIAVLDTGILPHPDFVQREKRIRCFIDFTAEQTAATPLLQPRESLVYHDPAGHGTHVAGILCGDGTLSHGKYCGVAPKSHIVCCKVLDDKGEGSAVCLRNAIHWVIAHKDTYQIRIMNLSLGNTKTGAETATELNRLVEEAWNAGLIVVASSGNSGPNRGSITAPGSAKKVITVGGEASELKPGRGPTEECVMKPELVAPSASITSTSAYLLSRIPERYQYSYSKRSGTSMATPLVSGAIALLLECNPSVTNKNVKEILKRTSVNLGVEKELQGWGRLSIKNIMSEI